MTLSVRKQVGEERPVPMTTGGQHVQPGVGRGGAPQFGARGRKCAEEVGNGLLKAALPVRDSGAMSVTGATRRRSRKNGQAPSSAS